PCSTSRARRASLRRSGNASYGCSARSCVRSRKTSGPSFGTVSSRPSGSWRRSRKPPQCRASGGPRSRRLPPTSAGSQRRSGVRRRSDNVERRTEPANVSGKPMTSSASAAGFRRAASRRRPRRRARRPRRTRRERGLLPCPQGASAELSAQMEVLLLSIMEPDRWLGVELRHLAALQALADEGSFGRAAERLGYTQSAVSQQIATLERIVGERLVERPGGPRPISLTEAGRLLLHPAQSIVARLQAAQADLAALRAGEAGSLLIGTFQSAGARLLPAIIRRYRDRWPQVEIRLDEIEDEAIALAVERGEIDVGFVLLPVGDAPLETTELLHDPHVLIVAAGSPLATRRPTLHE